MFGIGTVYVVRKESSFKEATYHKGVIQLVVNETCDNKDILSMLDDIARRFELDKEVLQQEYFIWCQVIKRQLSQIHKADFLEFGYFQNQVGKLDFQFYNDKCTNINGFYPSVKYVKRSNTIKEDIKKPVIPDTQANQKRLNIWTLLLPILVFSTLLLSSSIVNKDRINHFFNSNKIETTTKINQKKIESKKAYRESVRKKKKMAHVKAPKSAEKMRQKKESKNNTRLEESHCMIVTGSFQKVKNMEKMEKSLKEQFPNQVVKNIHGKYTRIGLRISCEDDTSIHRIKKIIASDAWLLKK